MMQSYDLVIVGGGSAGMAAAVSAYDKGIRSILLLEKDSCLGGILQQCIHNGFGLHEFKEELSGPQYAARFSKMLSERHIDARINAMVLNISRDLQVTYSSEQDGYVTVQAQAVVCATGCSERTRGNIAIPGTRPSGIMTAGLAQHYLNIDGYMVGRRVFILGSGDIGLIMARRLTLEGAKVLGVAEILPFTSGLDRNIAQCLNDFNIPLYLHHTVREVVGKDRVEKVVICPVDDNLQFVEVHDMEFEVDTLLLSVGLIPNNPLLEKIGVALHPKSRGPLVDENLMTSVPGIFACGNSLFVHDLVDFVTREGRRAGENAALYIRGELAPAPEADIPAMMPKPASTRTPVAPDEMVCIVCPRGCRIKASPDVDGSLKVAGNSCPRGLEYARAEFSAPRRMITSTVAVTGSSVSRLPVITSAPVPKERIFDVMGELSRVSVSAPIAMNQVIVPDVLGLGVDILAAREI